MRLKKNTSMESLKQRYGYSFVFHWVIGLVVFFFGPVLYSIRYAFSDITVTASGFKLDFVGIRNFKESLFENPTYLDQIRDSIGTMFYTLPMVLALSLILAVLLNQKFCGRTVMRIFFFLPVIIESSVILRLMSDSSINASIFNLSTEGTGIVDYNTVISNLRLPPQLSSFLTFFLSNAVSLTWSCGVQIILFLAGLQSIPDSLYEVSKIEGANKWEEFCQITVPMLRHVLSLVIIYTMISRFTASNNPIMATAIELMRAMDYSTASAMLWFYFVIVLAVVGIVLLFYNRYCIKRWE
ncbi:MAG: sugar ABC transporter permease [Clostridia bacterium]|nr:sugar ABC transporter permease [Clostridia bacterium]